MDLQLAEKARHRADLPINQDILQKLEQRLGGLHAKQRLGIEDDHEGQVFGQGLNFFHPENWYLSPSIIRKTLKMTGLYWRARKNAENIQIRRHDIALRELPASFDGFTILQISDKTAGGKRYALKVVRRQDADDDVYIDQAKVEYAAAARELGRVLGERQLGLVYGGGRVGLMGALRTRPCRRACT